MTEEELFKHVMKQKGVPTLYVFRPLYDYVEQEIAAGTTRSEYWKTRARRKVMEEGKTLPREDNTERSR